jgi:hypothetical protein
MEKIMIRPAFVRLVIYKISVPELLMSIRTLFAIASALITGGAVLAMTYLPQVAEARLTLN